jgi:hypothetical protein
MSPHERPHYVIKPSEIAKWLDREPGTWWIVDGDPRLTGEVDFPCPSGELSEALRRYDKKLFLFPAEPNSTGPKPAGQEIDSERLNDLSDRDTPYGARTFLLSWPDRDEDWILTEYPLSKLEEVRKS